MKVDSIIIEDSEGLHARPASELAKAAMGYKCDIKIITDEKEVNAKSVLAVMSLGAKQGTKLTLECDGEDEEEAISNLMEILRNN